MTSTPVAASVVAEQPARPGRLTFEEYLAWDDEGQRAEWVDGELVLMSPANLDHQRLITFIQRLLEAFVEARGLGEVFSAGVAMRLSSRPSGREPDVLFVSAANAERLKPTYIDGPADLVVEVVSPDSEVRDRGEKFLEYEAAGIPEYWLVDPLREAATFNLLDQERRYQRAALDAEGFFHSRALPGFRLKVEWLWQRPFPRVAQIMPQVEA